MLFLSWGIMIPVPETSEQTAENAELVPDTAQYTAENEQEKDDGNA